VTTQRSQFLRACLRGGSPFLHRLNVRRVGEQIHVRQRHRLRHDHHAFTPRATTAFRRITGTPREIAQGPASKTVPTPKAVLGEVAGAPGKRPYTEEVYTYMRMLEKTAPGRAQVVSIGWTEEGREMIAVAIGSDAIMAKLEENRARLATLADRRTINMDDAQAEARVNASTPIYYIPGTIHSTDTGAPTARMELADRLVVDDHEYITSIATT
jgi:hypothetical protein